MVLGWLGGGREDSVDELLRKKRFDKAIPLLKAQLERRKDDQRLRLRLGDVLLAAGHTPEALKVLRRISDEMAMAGQVGQAIAVLKKIEAADPGREDVEERLAYLIEQRQRPARDPWARTGGAGVYEPEEGELEIGFEPNRLDPEALPAGGEAAAGGAEPEATRASAPAPASASGESAAVSSVVRAVSQGRVTVTTRPLAELAELAERLKKPPAKAPASDAGAGAPERGTGDAAAAAPPGDAPDDFLADALLSLIEDTLRPASSPTEPPEKAVETPLFKSLSQPELAALIRGLRLLTFEPGEVVFAEGEPGTSLFLLTSGRVRAYVKNPAGRMVQVRELQEGDFFGEIAVLRGQPRSATITAGARCEMLELDRASLDRITETHPNVRTVLEDFCAQRAGNTLETMIRGMELEGRA